MKTFDTQSVQINVPAAKAFAYIADAANLPRWTNAFKSVDGNKALLETPQGAIPIELDTHADGATGSVDWHMTFPDGSVGEAFSRVTPEGEDKSIYTFVLMAPPVPLEMLEGALESQMAILAEELVSLKGKLEAA